MRILVIDQAPRTAKSQAPYDVAAIEALLNSYASPGTKVEIGFPDDFGGSNVFLTIGAQSALNGLHHMMEIRNTKVIGIRFAEMCVDCGMTQSASTYPRAKLSYDDFVT
jgi:hypothetical protein